MKISAQLTGPKDNQSQLKLDLSDMKDSNVHLRLPPEINPIVYQWTIKIYRGRNMHIEADWWSKIDP